MVKMNHGKTKKKTYKTDIMQMINKIKNVVKIFYKNMIINIIAIFVKENANNNNIFHV